MIKLGSEDNLRNAVFAADLHHGLKYYNALFGQDEDIVSDEELESGDIEWIQPESEEEARALMEEMDRVMNA